MSYILDALRRADSERERSAVPGLHAQPLRGAPDDDERRRGGLPWAVITIGLALALLAALAWILWPREAAPEAAAPPVVAAVPGAPAAPVTAPPPAVVPAPPPAPAPAPLPAVPVAAVAPAPAARVAPIARHTEAPAHNTKAKAASAAAATAPASAVAPEPRPPALKDLPDELRRQIPALAIGGSIYSESASSRFVIINGQLFHENDTLAPELTLKQIRLKSAILEFRGQRFELGY